MIDDEFDLTKDSDGSSQIKGKSACTYTMSWQDVPGTRELYEFMPMEHRNYGAVLPVRTYDHPAHWRPDSGGQRSSMTPFNREDALLHK